MSKLTPPGGSLGGRGAALAAALARNGADARARGPPDSPFAGRTPLDVAVARNDRSPARTPPPVPPVPDLDSCGDDRAPVTVEVV